MQKRPSEKRTGNYKIGKGRPPRATQWKPGQSGNPKGRPKGSKNMESLFREALNQKLEVQENGRTRRITAREGIVKRLVNQALKGDFKALTFLLAKDSEIARIDEATTSPRDVTPEQAMETYMRLIEAPRKLKLR